MKKSLTENIMTSKHSQQRTNPRKNKVEFLAMREDISEALEKGWSITIIWETLRNEGRFTATYNTFRLHVLKYLNGQKPGYSQMEAIEQRTKKPVANQAKEKLPSAISSFSFNPIPNLKELL